MIRAGQCVLSRSRIPAERFARVSARLRWRRGPKSQVRHGKSAAIDETLVPFASAFTSADRHWSEAATQRLSVVVEDLKLVLEPLLEFCLELAPREVRQGPVRSSASLGQVHV